MDNNPALCASCSRCSTIGSAVGGAKVITAVREELSGDRACRETTHPAGVRRRLLTLDAAAELLSLSKRTIYTLIGTGELQSVTVGRARRIPIDAIDDFVNELPSSHA